MKIQTIEAITSEAPLLPDWSEDVNSSGAKTWWSLGASKQVFSIYLSPVSGFYVLCAGGELFKHERLSDAQQEALDLDEIAQEKAHD